jgi:hypothetical protein
MMIFHHPDLRDGEYEREVLEFGRYGFKDMIDASAYCSALVDKYGYVGTEQQRDPKRSVAEAAGRDENLGYTLEELMSPELDGWDEIPERGVNDRAAANSLF